MEMLAGPRKLVTWIYENYYAALFNTCSGIFKIYFKFWKGQESLASLRRGLSEESCTTLHAPGSEAESSVGLRGPFIRKGRAGGWKEPARGREQSRHVSVTHYQGTTTWLEWDWTTGVFIFFVLWWQKERNKRSQLPLKRRDNRKQRPQAKAKPEGTWVRGSWTGRSWKSVKRILEDKTKTLGQGAINDSSHSKARSTSLYTPSKTQTYSLPME